MAGGAGKATIVFAVLSGHATVREVASGIVWSVLDICASVSVGIGSGSVVEKGATTATVRGDMGSRVSDGDTCAGNPASSTLSAVSCIGVPLRMARSSATGFEQHGHTGLPFIHPGYAKVWPRNPDEKGQKQRQK